MDSNAFKREIRRRSEALERANTPKFTIESFCFDKQIAFINDPARFKTAVCSRRSGKTVSCAADLIHTALTHPEGDVAYITLNRRAAKKIIWRQLLDINKQFQLRAKPDNTELTLTFPHGPTLHVTGAKDESEIEKLRGIALRKIYIDECQSFRPYIKELIEDVLEPTLIDYDGTMVLIGTPGPLAAGLFYEASHGAGWSNHKWTIADNPHILRKSGKSAEQIIAETCARRGVSPLHPSIQREFFGQWVYDQDALVFQFDAKRNIYLPVELPTDLMYVVGVDIGYVDADAIAVLGYSPSHRCVYLVHEDVTDKQNITDLVDKIKALKRRYAPVKLVMDAGALGKKIQEEIRTRHSLHLDAADKHRKLEFIELLNDDLRTSKLKAPTGSRFEQDSYLAQWDRSDPFKPKIDTAYHSDIHDAVLYAWRECKHFYELDAEPPKAHTDAYMAALEQKEADEMQQRKDGQGMQQFTDVESWDDLGVTDLDWGSDE